MVDKTLNRKLKIEQHEPHKNNGVRLVVSSQLPWPLGHQCPQYKGLNYDRREYFLYLGTNLIIITSLTYLPLPVCHGMVDL